MSIWGPLSERYETKMQRKMLSLDGGGIRGLITLEFLADIERKLKIKLNKDDDFRLSDYFDYIGGTSTGAIIAAGLSIGMSVHELIDFYKNKGREMFDRNFILKQWKSFYGSGHIIEMLKETFGENTDLNLKNGIYKCMLLVVTMNRTTDSPWPINNNPKAKYNQENRKDCNLQIKLHQLVRASTAAPIYFPPEIIQWDKNDPEKSFVFVDGGVTPYNNPAFLMYKMATQPAYNLGWETGEDKLLLVSVGTGSAPSGGKYHNLVDSLRNLPNNLMYVMQVDQDINCRTVGRCTFGASIDNELYSMIPMDPKGNILDLSQDTRRHFLYVRYNADLSQEGLNKIGFPNIKSDEIREMDSVDHIEDLQKVGSETAKQQVDLKHFGTFL